MSRAWLSLFQCCGASMGVAVTSGSGRCLRPALLLNTVHCDIKSRKEDQRQHGSDREPADDGVGHRAPRTRRA